MFYLREDRKGKHSEQYGLVNGYGKTSQCVFVSTSPALIINALGCIETKSNSIRSLISTNSNKEQALLIQSIK